MQANASKIATIAILIIALTIGICVQYQSNSILSTQSSDSSSTKPSSSLRERAFQAFQADDIPTARQYFLQAYYESIKPNHRTFSASDLYNLASLLHDEDPIQATLFYQKSIEAKYERSHHAWHNLGEIATQQNQLKQAKMYYRHALQHNSNKHQEKKENNIATIEALSRLDLLISASVYKWSNGLSRNNAEEWSKARLNATNLLEIKAWCGVAASSLLVSDSYIEIERNRKLLTSPGRNTTLGTTLGTKQSDCATTTSLHSSYYRRICFGNMNEGIYVGTSIHSNTYMDLPHYTKNKKDNDTDKARALQTSIDNGATLATKEYEEIYFKSFLNRTFINLDMQRDHCGDIVINLPNARRASTFINPLRDPLIVEEGCYGDTNLTLVLVNGFHRLFEMLTRRKYVGKIPIVRKKCSKRNQKKIHNIGINQEQIDAEKNNVHRNINTHRHISPQIKLATTLLQKVATGNSNNVDRDVLSAFHLLTTDGNTDGNNNRMEYNSSIASHTVPHITTFHSNASFKLLHSLSIHLSPYQKYKDEANQAYQEAEKRALASRSSVSFINKLQKYQQQTITITKILKDTQLLQLEKDITIHHINTKQKNKIWSIHNILTSFECNQIIQLYQKKMKQSDVSLPKIKNKSIRTSTTAFISKTVLQQNPIFQLLRIRLSHVLNLPVLMQDVSNLEIQLVRYRKQELFAIHHDAGPLYPRIFSMFIYLNDVLNGGETCFPNIDLNIQKKDTKGMANVRSGGCNKVEEKVGKEMELSYGVCFHPVIGQSVLWYNLLTNGRKDVRMEHEGCTLRDEGSNVEKWGLNVWFSL